MPDSEVEVKLKATGADETAAEIKKVEKSTEDLGKTSTSVAGTAGKLKGIAASAGAIGIATAAAAKTFGQIQEQIDSIDITQLRRVDSAMADNIESARDWARALEDPIGALLKLTTGETVASAFSGMNKQLALTAKQHEEAIDRFIAKGIIQKDKLKELADAIKAANAILDAKDDADGSARDRKDAAAIRGGAAEEDVASERVKYNAKRDLAKIDRDLNAQASGVQAAYENATQAKANEARMAGDSSVKREDKDKAAKEKADLVGEYAAKKRDFETSRRIAEEGRRGVREESAGSLEDLAAKKGDRLGREREKEQRAKQQAATQAADQAAAAARTRAGAVESDRRAAGKTGRDAEKLLPDGVTAEFRKAVESASAALQDGGTAKELAELAELLGQLGGSTNSAVGGIRSQLAAVKAEIAILQKQLKNR